MINEVTDEKKAQIAGFIEKSGLQVAIERVEENPMGPDQWQIHFIHYALWLSSKHGQIPFYFSYDRNYLSPFSMAPAWLRAEAQNPTREYVLYYSAKVVKATMETNSFQNWCAALGYPMGEAFEYYYQNVCRYAREFQRIFPGDLLIDFMDLDSER